MHERKFWPLDYDPEGELYENPAWDLPGFRRTRPTPATRKARAPHTVRRPAASQVCR